MEVLEALADNAYADTVDEAGVDLTLLSALPPAIGTRVLRRAAIEAGAIASELTRAHVRSVLDAGTGKEIQLPGHVTAYRSDGRIGFRET